MAYSGKFYPQNPHKYRGNINNIVWRSTWELRFLKYLDETESVIEYGSEEIVIPYFSPIDNFQKLHRYYVDFYVKLRDKSGEIKTYIVEIKPAYQTIPPKQKKRMTKHYFEEMQTYAVNQAKWEAARNFAKKNSIEFLVLTENDLFKKE